MTPRHWWIGLSLVLATWLLLHFFPRYECHTPAPWVRIDRWTGKIVGGCNVP